MRFYIKKIMQANYLTKKNCRAEYRSYPPMNEISIIVFLQKFIFYNNMWDKLTEGGACIVRQLTDFHKTLHKTLIFSKCYVFF